MVVAVNCVCPLFLKILCISCISTHPFPAISYFAHYVLLCNVFPMFEPLPKKKGNILPITFPSFLYVSINDILEYINLPFPFPK